MMICPGMTASRVGMSAEAWKGQTRVTNSSHRPSTAPGVRALFPCRHLEIVWCIEQLTGSVRIPLACISDREKAFLLQTGIRLQRRRGVRSWGRGGICAL